MFKSDRFSFQHSNSGNFCFCYQLFIGKSEYILNKKIDEYAERLRNSGNEYLTERAKDIWDIFGRVLNEMLDYHPFNIESVPDGSVIVAQGLSPSDTIILSKRKIIGLALTEGGISSHVAILARNYGIPAVFALEKITSKRTLVSYLTHILM